MNFLEKASPDCACWSTTPATRTPESRDMRRDFAFFLGGRKIRTVACFAALAFNGFEDYFRQTHLARKDMKVIEQSTAARMG